ncbi:hypothetical protein BDV96DRAFT_573098 [Lophiotrema nucula]|uniref:FAD/NAD(P)-binding domain-containing protein n=1 Tax=Lophiotrema nucula TaxID=690887 RepID=A0A6A5ZDU5_9PLEO|nr:hypothetical protein BDV96DRAFT_573098 [Lophiotrema nucula]
MSTENIVIIGASFAGLGAAHYALKHVVPQLPKKGGKNYTVTLINPSKDFYWRIAGPRAAVSKTLMPESKYIFPIAPGFKSYPKGSFNFVQGTATHIDSAARTVSVTTAAGEHTQIPYAALVLATGISTPSPLFTQTTDAAGLSATYDSFQKVLPTAKTIIIGGAGPVGVEVGGEIAEFLNGKPGWFQSKPKNQKAKVIIVSAEKKMLPILRESISKKAEKFLKRIGGEVIYNTKVVAATQEGRDIFGPTKVVLSNGKTLNADIYIDATGGRPQTSFIPAAWLDQRNKINCNTKTLRVDVAGPRVYVVGDAGSYTRGGVIDMANAIPVALTNLKIDLTSQITGRAPTQERHYTADNSESQILPIGPSKGVGAFGGWSLPSFMIKMIKGKDYMSKQMALPTVEGKQWAKEGKWKPQPVAAFTEKVGFSSG